MTHSISSQGLWAVREVAAYLGVPTSSIYKMTSTKARVTIPHVRIAGRLRFRKADIDRWLDLSAVSNLDILEKVGAAARKANGVNPSQEDA